MVRGYHSLYLVVLLLGALLAGSCAAIPGAEPQPIVVGLLVPLTGNAANAGEAIRRGILLAIADINAAGGVLGRPIKLVVRESGSEPQAANSVLQALLEQEHPVAVFSGIDNAIVLAQLGTIHRQQVVLIDPWATARAITRNGYQPNYAFRVAVDDHSADLFLVRYLREVLGGQRPGILAEQSAWGDANVAGLTGSLAEYGVSDPMVERFDPGETDMRIQIQQLRAGGVDSLIMVAESAEAGAIMRARRLLGWGAPVVSHWAVTDGRFVESAGIENIRAVYTIQTFSFVNAQSPLAQRVLAAYHATFKTSNISDIAAPSGVAHGYDGMRLLALAIQQAGTTDRPQIRAALEDLQVPYDGLIKRYERPFSVSIHDALTIDEYFMAIWQDGELVPVPQPILPSAGVG